MASQKSARRSRKRHASAKAPRAVPSQRRERAAERAAEGSQKRNWESAGALSAYGERPPSPFGGLPVAEVAIFLGAIAIVIGWIQGGSPALFAGLAVCFLGVLEVTAREHFSGYRSHSTLLAAMAAVAVETVLGLLVARHAGPVLLIIVVPVFGATFLALRRRFTAARQARIRAVPRG